MADKRLLAERGSPSPPSTMGAGGRSPSPSSRLSFSASAEASGAARFSKGRYPPTLTMVTEAVGALNEKKGSSTAAIKRYIRHNYPGVDPIRLKYYLRKALLKGLEKGYLVRPLNSSAQGATGRFKLAAIKPKKGKAKRAQPAQGEGPPPKPEKKKKAAAAEGKARAENPKGKGKAGAEGKEKATSKKAKTESDPVLAAGPAELKPKEKTAAEGKAPKKPRIPKTLQVKLAKPPTKAPPKGEAKTATKGKARPKAGAGGKAEPPEGELVKAAKGSQAKSQAGASKARAPKTGAPKAGKRAVAKGKKKEAEGGAGPEDT